MAKPVILILENSIAVTGALKSILNSSIMLREEFDFVFVLPTASHGVPLIAAAGFPVHELPLRELNKNFLSLPGYLPRLFKNARRLKELIGELKVNLVVSNDFYNMVPPLYRIRGGTVPYICFVRFIPSRFPYLLRKMWVQMHYRYASSVIAVSEVVKEGLPWSAKTKVILQELPFSTLSPEFQQVENPVILYLSNYVRGKGQEYALRSFARLAAKYPSWRLKFVGGDLGLEKNIVFGTELQALAANLNIQDRIVWQGYTEDVRAEYERAGIVVNFSDSESFSLTCQEAMYYGKPLIATRSGGPAELIDDGETGLLVPVRDIDAMTAALDRLLSDSELRSSLARNGYQSVRRKFAPEQTVQKLKGVYLRACPPYIYS
jgi:glycosyltransferase involved in cell wall biosynthesis